MKIWNVILLISVCYTTGYAQDLINRCGEVFNAEKYPADSFSVRKTTYPLGNTEIIFTQLHHDYFEEEAGLYQIWIEQRESGKVLKSEYWGFEEGENGYQLPIQQPIKDHFMVNRSREFTGTFYLISSTGMWHKIPGGEIYLDKGISILYTFVPVECGGCQIGRFDLKSKQLTTKVWDGRGIAWEGISDHSGLMNVFENGEWIKW